MKFTMIKFQVFEIHLQLRDVMPYFITLDIPDTEANMGYKKIEKTLCAAFLAHFIPK
jgi:hypothetical protein